jgi:hypothetical protein
MRIEGKFSGTDDDGNSYTVLMLRGQHRTFDQHHGEEWVDDALGELQTEDGRAVSPVSRGVYDIIDGTEAIRITSDDPDAP